MAPRTITYPPTGEHKDQTTIQFCLDYNNDDTLLIEFIDPGHFYDDNQDAFTDPIPTGKFGPNIIM